MGQRAVVVFWALSLLLVGCDDGDEEIAITSVIDREPNEAPSFVAQGPSLDEPIEIVRTGGSGIGLGPTLWVQVADANGIDDISTVVVDVDSVAIHGLIARPDTSESGCSRFTYDTSDTLDLSALVGGIYAGVESRVMDQIQGGRFETYPFFFVEKVLPELTDISDALGPAMSYGCTDNTYLELIGVYPPRVETPIDVFVTMLDVEFIGISATAYDASGESANLAFPNMRLVITTAEERQAAP
jgi:hypothetical protein